MSLFSALRDFAGGLSSGFSLFITERHEVAVAVLAPPAPRSRKRP